MSEFPRFSQVSNDSFRLQWIEDQLRNISKSEKRSLQLLDVGAGSSPFREVIERLGFDYKSNDFNNYRPDFSALGQQNSSWEYAKHDFICDILEIPESQKFDIIICIEVLEHVKDPVKVVNKISNLLKPGGYFIATVPLHSLIHQAPHYYSSGLSPFWFKEHLRNFYVAKDSISISGDFKDFIFQEISRALEHSFFGSFKHGMRLINTFAKISRIKWTRKLLIQLDLVLWLTSGKSNYKNSIN